MSLKRNVVANYLGQFWVAIMGLAFVPLYIRYLGVEAYGLVGVFSVLLSSLTVLDMGLTPTLTREMARMQAGAHTALSIRNLLRSLEALYCALACAVIVATFFGATAIAGGWLKLATLPQPIVEHSIQVMGFVLAGRWLEQVYRGALQGLQDLVWLNATQAIFATFRWGGAFLVVALVFPTITAFFLWQGCVSFFSLTVLVVRTYRLLPVASQAAQASLTALRPVWRFAGGMFISALLTILLTQTDKLVISKILPLEQLGYYALATSVAGALIQLMGPMNAAVFPKLIEYATRNDERLLGDIYLRACEWMAVIMVPPAITLAFFSEPILLLWTGNSDLSRSAAPLVSLLVLGTLFNGFMNLPYMLQLAYGWTGLAIWINTVAVALTVPLTVWAVKSYGAAGAAMVWLSVNAGYLLITAHIMHRKLLARLKWRWYATAVIRPLLAAVIPATVLLTVLPTFSDRLSAGITVAIGIFAIELAVVGSSPIAREATLKAIVRMGRASRLWCR